MALGTLILTPEQMRKMEQLYFAESGVASIEVMEQAKKMVRKSPKRSTSREASAEAACSITSMDATPDPAK